MSIEFQGRNCPKGLSDMSRWGMDEAGSSARKRGVVHSCEINDLEKEPLSITPS
ncbi:MAG: hypothetical protein ACFFA1_00125 [Promethearchaeota archaeon]